MSESLTVIVHVDADTPFATAEAEQVNEEFATLGVCALNVVLAVSVVSCEGAVSVKVRAPTVVAVTEHERIPLASVLPVVRQLEVTDEPEVTLK